MALYDYQLVMCREAANGALLPALYEQGWLQRLDGGQATLLGMIDVAASESIDQSDANRTVDVVRMSLDTDALERVLSREASAFVSWLWNVVEATNIAYAFLGPETYAAAAYVRAGKIEESAIAAHLRDVVYEGAVKIVHPLMYFARRIGDGRVCELARGAPLYTVHQRDHIGCLLLLIDGNLESNEVEILDPGSVYGQLRHHFARRTS